MHLLIKLMRHKKLELFDSALGGGEKVLVKLHLSIPVEKYTEGSNPYFEVASWEIVE